MVTSAQTIEAVASTVASMPMHPQRAQAASATPIRGMPALRRTCGSLTIVQFLGVVAAKGRSRRNPNSPVTMLLSTCLPSLLFAVPRQSAAPSTGVGAGVGLAAHAVTVGASRLAITRWRATQFALRSAVFLATRQSTAQFNVAMANHSIEGTNNGGSSLGFLSKLVPPSFAPHVKR